MKRLLLLSLLLPLSLLAGRNGMTGWCEVGGKTVSLPGMPPSTTKVQQTYPLCTVSVFLHGTKTLASIYSDDVGTALANPFTAGSDGSWQFFADDGRYDLQFSGGGMTGTFTRWDEQLMDYRFFQPGHYPAAPSAVERTVKHKLADVVNVKDFGAVCDGSTDDTNAILAAVEYGAKIITFPPGVCATTGLSLINYEGITLAGSGSGQDSSSSGTTLKYTGAANGTLIEWKSNRWSVLRDMYLDCNSLAGIGLYNWADMGIASSQKNSFINLGIRGCTGTPGHAIHVGNPNDADVSQSDWNQITLWASPVGLYQEGTQTLLHAYRNFSVLATTTGMYFAEGDVRMEHCTFVQPTSAVDDVYVAGPVLWATFFNNYHEVYAGRPVNARAYNFATSGTRAYPTNFIGNRILWIRASGRLIDYSHSGYLTLIGNTFSSLGGTGTGNVYINNGGGYKTQALALGNTLETNITYSTAGNTAFLRDYNLVAGETLPTGTQGALFSSDYGATLDTVLVGGATDDGVSPLGVGGSITIPNFSALRIKDSGGTGRPVITLAPDNTVGVGAINAPASNGHLLLYANGVEGARLVPGGRLVVDPAGSDDGSSRLQVAGVIKTTGYTFAALPAAQNGSTTYCSDCTANSNPCTGSGGGAIAKRLAGAWDCR